MKSPHCLFVPMVLLLVTLPALAVAQQNVTFKFAIESGKVIPPKSCECPADATVTIAVTGEQSLLPVRLYYITDGKENERTIILNPECKFLDTTPADGVCTFGLPAFEQRIAVMLMGPSGDKMGEVYQITRKGKAGREARAEAPPTQSPASATPPVKPIVLSDKQVEEAGYDSLMIAQERGNHLAILSDGRIHRRHPEPWQEERVVYVHLLVHKTQADMYKVTIAGKAYDYNTFPIAGTAQVSAGFMEVSQVKTPLLQTDLLWMTWQSPYCLSGEEAANITVLFNNSALMPPITFPLEKTYRYQLGMGLTSSRLGELQITRAPGPGDTTILARRNAGRGLDGIFTVNIYPHKRPVYRDPDHGIDKWSLVLGTTTADPLKTVLYGIGFELAPGVTLIGGEMRGPVSVLAPGYEFEDVVPATGNLPTVERNETSDFIGVTFGTAFWDKLWKKATK